MSVPVAVSICVAEREVKNQMHLTHKHFEGRMLIATTGVRNGIERLVKKNLCQMSQ
jgi:hypothetical protein